MTAPHSLAAELWLRVTTSLLTQAHEHLAHAAALKGGVSGFPETAWASRRGWALREAATSAELAQTCVDMAAAFERSQHRTEAPK